MVGRSPTINLMILIHSASSALEAGFQVNAVYTYFCEALDTVDHNIILFYYLIIYHLIFHYLNCTHCT